jgi:hypothetical protein
MRLKGAWFHSLKGSWSQPLHLKCDILVGFKPLIWENHLVPLHRDAPAPHVRVVRPGGQRLGGDRQAHHG